MASRPKHWKHRILSVGRDHALTAFLKDQLKRLDCFVVQCPRGTEARIFIESEVRYSLFLFDEQLMDMTGKELVQLTQAVKHRQRTPILIVKKSDEFDVLVNKVRRLLG